MLSAENRLIISNCLADIAKNLRGFQSREGQRQMIAEVAQALARTAELKPAAFGEEVKQQGESILVIEGPTGTGKSLGYLLPAVVMAKSLGKKLVVSSATVALQEQLANKDIPFLAQHTGLKISYAIAKGRGRYACTYRLKQSVGEGGAQAEQMDFLQEHDANIYTSNSNQAAGEKWRHLVNLLDTQQWAGDRDMLSEFIPDNIWSPITNDRHGCVKKLCAYFNACPFFTARNELEKVDIIIANHDLLLADIAMGGGFILPHPAETFYCIDEAHNLADKAVKQFAAMHTLNGTLSWLEKFKPTLSRASALLKEHRQATQIQTQAESVADYLIDLRTLLASMAELKLQYATDIPIVLRFAKGVLPNAIAMIGSNLASSTQILSMQLNLFCEILKKKQADHAFGSANSFRKTLTELGFFQGRVENLAAVWQLMETQTVQEEPPIAKWITAESVKNKNEVEYTLCASPVRAASLLATNLWNRVAGAVLTSATLQSLGSFDMLLAETGLQAFPATTCIALASPFDFKRQGRLNLPAMKSDPKDPVAHTQEIIQLLPKLIQTVGNHGTLVLFASKKQMLDVAQAVPKTLRQLLLMQGEHSKEILIKNHFARINANQASILFGLATLAEGLDLPGAACTHVIIAKLPFIMPDDPISKTLAEWVTQRGGNPFLEITLPNASIKLIQAVGRLIRSESDTGTVTILDTRLKTMPYGRQMLKSLPPFLGV